MTDSVYRKTPLPVKLNLNDRNTREQLSTSAEADNGRGALEGVGLASAASQSQKNCTEVMVKELREWLATHGITGPPPSAEAEQRAMWKWIRDFHKEYNDDWFSRNMPRLHEQFRPVFVNEMKKMKAEIKAAEAAAPPAPAANSAPTDLLDFDSGPTAPTPAAPSTGSKNEAMSDLLSLDAPTAAAPSAPAVASQAPVYAATPAPAPAATGGYGAGLAPAVPAAPASNAAGLLDLDLGGLSAPNPTPAQPAPPPAVHTTPAPATTTKSQGSDLLDLMM